MNDTPYTGPKVTVKLVGEDGNAFSIIGRVVEAMRKAKFSKEVIAEYRQRAMSGDYNHLLSVTFEYISEPDEDQSELFECEYCGDEFDNEDELDDHIESEHSDYDEDEEE